jgi:predicted  nucleic acid-binding Zn-ribbon protein
MEALPAKLAPAKADLIKLETILTAERKKVEETEAWRKEQEGLIKAEEEAVKLAKSKLQSSQNARDNAAANREIANKRRNMSEREDEVLKVFEAMELTKKNLETHSADVEKLRARVATEEAAFAEKLKVLEGESSQFDEERQKIASQIEPTLLKRYEHALKKRGLAIVKVKNGVCHGCNMSLPPQLANELARFETVETCPQCHRLLYHSALVEGVDSEAAS